MDERIADPAETEHRRMNRHDQIVERIENRRERGPYRSLFWPVVLIGVGALWLLGNVGLITNENLSVLWRLWPLLLIVVGLDVLVGRGSPAVGGAIGLLAVGLVVVLVLVGPAMGLATQNEQIFGTRFVAPSAEIQADNLAVPLEGTTSAQVTLDLSRGPTTVSALAQSSDQLFAGTIRHVAPIQFNASGSSGAKSVHLGVTGFDGLMLYDSNRLRWDINLAQNVPTDLTIGGGSGSADLNLSAINLTGFTLQGGSGSADLSLPAAGAAYNVNIDGGSGSLTANVASGASITGSVAGGSGSINLSIGADSDATLDVRGASGSVTIDLPQNVGVRIVSVGGGSGSLSVPDGLTQVSGGGNRNAGTWESAGFASAAHQIVINITGVGSGSISIH